MRRQMVLPLAFLLIAFGVPSFAQNAAEVVVAEGAPLSVECALRVEQRAQWTLNGSALPADVRAAPEAAPQGRLTARLAAPRARAHHAGVYACAPGSPPVRVRVLPAGT